MVSAVGAAAVGHYKLGAAAAISTLAAAVCQPQPWRPGLRRWLSAVAAINGHGQIQDCRHQRGNVPAAATAASAAAAVTPSNHGPKLNCQDPSLLAK